MQYSYDLFKKRTDILGKPFLRWTGGKKWLVPEISKLVSKIDYIDYHEPFLGGGSIFFGLSPSNNSFLSDKNYDLINAYKQVKTNPVQVIERLAEFPQNKDTYYKIRSQNFTSEIDKACKFIYLNKTSFNGIYRVNKDGNYNVPYGKKTFNIEFMNDVITSASKQLENVHFDSLDFENIINKVKRHDLVYLDPPYNISHTLNGFVEYNEQLFSEYDQNRLSNMIDKIKEKKAYYILSNACHQKIYNIYYKEGDRVITLERRSLISGEKRGRGLYKEYIFTNIK